MRPSPFSATYDIDRWALVRAIYAYVAQGADEISIKEGEQIELTSGPTGGQFYGDGWWEGRTSR